MLENRKEAGLQLAKVLQKYRNDKPLVLAIPRGGVEVGYYIANKLECDLSVLVSRKLGFPEQPEAAFGALAEDGSLYLNSRVQRLLTREMIEQAIEKTEKEITRRIDIYRNGEPLPTLKGRTVILVDDGIATGSTMFAAIELCRKQQVGNLIVASPLSSISMVQRLQHRVDEVLLLETPRTFYAVSQGYKDFRNLTDKEVLGFLEAGIKPSKKES